MTNENAREVYRALREAQNKYTYFLFAARLSIGSKGLRRLQKNRK